MQKLLDAEACVDKENVRGITPLIAVSVGGDNENIVRMLIEAKADVNKKGFYGNFSYTPLSAAILCENDFQKSMGTMKPLLIAEKNVMAIVTYQMICYAFVLNMY